MGRHLVAAMALTAVAAGCASRMHIRGESLTVDQLDRLASDAPRTEPVRVELQDGSDADLTAPRFGPTSVSGQRAGAQAQFPYRDTSAVVWKDRWPGGWRGALIGAAVAATATYFITRASCDIATDETGVCGLAAIALPGFGAAGGALLGFVAGYLIGAQGGVFFDDHRRHDPAPSPIQDEPGSRQIDISRALELQLRSSVSTSRALPVPAPCRTSQPLANHAPSVSFGHGTTTRGCSMCSSTCHLFPSYATTTTARSAMSPSGGEP